MGGAQAQQPLPGDSPGGEAEIAVQAAVVGPFRQQFEPQGRLAAAGDHHLFRRPTRRLYRMPRRTGERRRGQGTLRGLVQPASRRAPRPSPEASGCCSRPHPLNDRVGRRVKEVVSTLERAGLMSGAHYRGPGSSTVAPSRQALLLLPPSPGRAVAGEN